MLVQFTVANFQSFQQPSTLAMHAAKRRSQNKDLDKNSIFHTTGPASQDDALALLKVAAIYGANGSGKTNLLRALQFMKHFVLYSSRESQAGETIPVEPFLFCDANENKPSEFEITFVHERVLYQYSFSADSTSVRSEKLTKRGPRNKRDITLFERFDNDILLSKKNFPEGDRLESKTRSNSLFLSVCANFSGPISTSVLEWFRKVRVIRSQDDNGYKSFTFKRLMETEWNSNILDFVSGFDLGIERLSAIQLHSSDSIGKESAKSDQTKTPLPELRSFHNKFDREGNLIGEAGLDFSRRESQGTQKLVSLAGPLLDTLSNAYVLIIDEFDSRLHPIISRKLLEMFNSDYNSNNAQLIVATHDSNLLDKDLLRRDQIWFVEKDNIGGSHMHSLIEYKIRNDASYEKDYIAGKYGAIPLLGNIRRIFVNESVDRTEEPLEDVFKNSAEDELA